MRSNFTNQGKKRNKKKAFAYSDLEQRQLLATMTGFSGGALTIDMDASGDTAIVAVNAAGEVTVNGDRDMDSSTGATDVVLAVDVDSIDVNGTALVANQETAFDGTFNLDSLEVTDVSGMTFLGDYNIGDLTVVLEGNSLAVGDATGSSLTVTGTTDINARNNDIILNDNVDLAGPVRLSTLGGFDINISDVNDILLERVDASGSLTLNAVGDIEDVSGSSIETRDAFFTAANVTLGDSASDTVNFFRSGFQVPGQVNLTEDSNIILLSSNMGSLVATSEGGGIYDGRTTTVEIAGNANLDADFGVRLGEHGLDTFNADSLTINSLGHVHIFEDSSTMFVGSTTARTMDVTSLGDIEDDVNASIVTTFATGFEGDNVVLGESLTDTLDLGGVYFWSLGDVSITENDDIFVIDEKNRADRLTLSAPGFMIADDTDAKITVDRLSTFVADDVTIGDTVDDRFNAGSIMFDVVNQFFIREDSGTNIAGNNTSDVANIGSAGNITNPDEATVNVTNNARFLGENIDLGNQSLDEMNFGGLIVITPGDAIISENSATMLTGPSEADLLAISSPDTISNANSSSIIVTRVANFQGTNGVNIGNAVNDEFRALAVTGNSVNGNVLLSEDDAMFLTGVNNANAMTLASTETISNAQNSSINVATRLTTTAVGIINLGTKVDATTGNPTDRVEFGSFNFNTAGNVNVEAESEVLFVGSSASENLNVTARDGATDLDISDFTDAEIVIATDLFLTGLDIEIGELASDCLDVGGSVNVTASGINNVVLGC